MNDQSFSSLGLAETILSALARQGYETPTPIQSASIPSLLAGRDLLGCAQTGTGKTAAFALPIIQRLAAMPVKPAPRGCRALVVAPTRELAAQIDASFAAYGANTRMSHACVFGGVGKSPQVRALSRGVDVLTATPGRLLDLHHEGQVRLDSVEVVVLDEADRMLDMGFIQDVRRIIALLPKRRQTLLFSATMPNDISGLANSILRDPVRVSVTPNKPTVDLIDQKVAFVEKGEKRAYLAALINAQGDERALVFTRTKHGADKLAKALTIGGIPRRGHPRQQEPEQPRARDGGLQGRRAAHPGRDRHRRARHRRRRHQPCLQLRPARGGRDLRAPHRPHCARRSLGLRDLPLRPRGEAPPQGDREAPPGQRPDSDGPCIREGRRGGEEDHDRGSGCHSGQSRARPQRPRALRRPEVAHPRRQASRGPPRGSGRGARKANDFVFFVLQQYICRQGDKPWK